PGNLPEVVRRPRSHHVINHIGHETKIMPEVSISPSETRPKGNRALQTGRRGRRPGEQQALDPRQQARVRRAILHKIPDQVALPGLVWTRPQVRQLIRDWFGVGLSLVTIGKYLRSWSLSPQKPVRRAYEQNPEAVTHWLEVQYPAIEARARKEKAIVLWLDQTGLRSDAAVGTTWAPVGQTPVVAKTGRDASAST
ncbi:winged helix-turn-helix domain-containing protein, partial [Dactylosporangium sp. NPDC051484]|uniref:winged helix-turn-helix domain-containing protein n=1 Tax=Dactylosporangium sp. NPDC051484 TaxID=3154942 RepID=UPI00344C7801